MRKFLGDKGRGRTVRKARARQSTSTASVNGYGGTPTGTVEDGGTVLDSETLSSGGQATFDTSALTLGNHSICAMYQGDNAVAGSSSYTLTQTVQLQTSWTYLSSSADPSTVGQAVTLTAMVSGYGATPTGTVTFEDGATVLGTGTLSAGGQATFTTASLTLGNHALQAVYSGDAADLGSTSGTLTQTVNAPAAGTIWTVINTLDNGAGDLPSRRGDLRFCRLNAGAGDTIQFQIEDGDGNLVLDPVINVSHALPFITHALILDGYTQAVPGGLPNSENGITTAQVQIYGAGLSADGLDVNAGGVTIQGLALYDFNGNGVVLNNPYGSAGDVLQGCNLGTDLNGTAGVGNITGVLVEGGNDTVGDAAGVATTIVSGNQQDGIDVSGVNAVRDLINDVWVGVGLTGLAALGNGANGVNVAGGAAAGGIKLSVISGQMNGDAIALPFSEGFLIAGNYIGVGADGATSVGNAGDGVDLGGVSANNNMIGTHGFGGRNVIADNGKSGIELKGNATNTLILGNWIGLDAHGNKAANLGRGVYVHGGASSNTIGGTGPMDGNVISGNASDGVTIDGTGTSKNVIAGDFIGTNVAGTAAVANGGNGVTISSGASDNTVGALAVWQEENDTTVTVISGNTKAGVAILAGCNNNQVINCYIGTDVTGAAKIGNLLYGIDLEGDTNWIGGLQLGSKNVISGNGIGTWIATSGFGIYVTGAGAKNNVIENNYIGTNFRGTVVLGNTNSGIYFLNSGTGNTVGGTVNAATNVVSANGTSGAGRGGYGVEFHGSTGNTVEHNYIGIAKDGSTVLPNVTDWLFGATGNTVTDDNRHQ